MSVCWLKPQLHGHQWVLVKRQVLALIWLTSVLMSEGADITYHYRTWNFWQPKILNRITGSKSCNNNTIGTYLLMDVYWWHNNWNSRKLFWGLSTFAHAILDYLYYTGFIDSLISFPTRRLWPLWQQVESFQRGLCHRENDSGLAQPVWSYIQQQHSDSNKPWKTVCWSCSFL